MNHHGNENWPIHKEAFEVVMLRDGVSQMLAEEKDLRRVSVEASDTLQAQMHDDVRKEKGWHPIGVAKPGILIESEVMARRRALEGPPIDRSKL